MTLALSLQRKLDGRSRPARKDETGTWRCRWCEGPCPGRKRSFCSEECVHQWRLRTDTMYLRAQVFARDRGVCAVCSCDTEALMAKLRALRLHRRSEFYARIKACGIPEHRVYGSLWDADHVVPVSEGGGECDLSNIRTLCIPCHADATADLARRRARRKGTP